MQPADRSLCPGRGGPLAKDWVLSGILRTLVVAGPFPLLGGADKTWCLARGLNWKALCQARKLRGELLELMQRIELPLSQPAFGSEQNRRDLQKALVSGYFLKVRGKSCGEDLKRRGRPRDQRMVCLLWNWGPGGHSTNSFEPGEAFPLRLWGTWSH